MQEKDANGKARDAIRKQCAGSWVKKLNDRMTKGLPDTVVAWSSNTSWLEFKMLTGDESIHNELDPIQLVELIRLEHNTHRAWVIAYRKSTRTLSECVDFYRPTLLFNNHQPIPKEPATYANMLQQLHTTGVARFGGFNHAAVAELIKQTHATY